MAQQNGATTRRHSRRKPPRVSYADAGGVDEDEVDEDADDLDFGARYERKEPIYRAQARDARAQAKAAAADATYTGGSGIAKPNKRRKKNLQAKETPLIEPTPNLLLTLPLDILAAIFSRLRPIDLLLLSRVNKSLREWLISAEADSVWIASRKNMTFKVIDRYGFSGGDKTMLMPAPLPGLSHAAYAKLLFGQNCYDCNTSYAPVYLYLQRRLCINCKNRNTESRSTIEEEIKTAGGNIHLFALKLVPSNGFDYHIPSLVEAHEVMKKKKADMPNSAYRTWAVQRSDRMQAARIEVPKVQSWLDQYKVHYKDEDTLLAEERSREAATRRCRLTDELARRLAEEAWYSTASYEDYECSETHARIVSGPHPLSDDEWSNVIKGAERYFESCAKFRSELAAWSNAEGMRNWVRKKYSEDAASLEDGTAYSLPSGDLFSLPALQHFFELKPPANTFPDYSAPHYDTEDETPPPYMSLAPSREGRQFLEDCDEAWASVRNTILEEAGERKIKILASFAEALIGIISESKQVQLEDAIADAQDVEVPQADRLHWLLDALDTVYAIFSCKKCSSVYHTPIMTTAMALSHDHFCERAFHTDYYTKVNKRRPRGRRPVPFDGKYLRAHRTAIEAVHMLLAACRTRQTDLADSSKGRLSLVPHNATQGVKQFNNGWRFTCSHRAKCNEESSVNIFTKMVHRDWDDMIEHVEDHINFAEFAGVSDFKSSSIGITKYRGALARELDDEAGSDEENEKARFEEASSPLSEVESAPLSPLSDLSSLSDDEE